MALCCGDDQDHKRLLTRLNRIDGQLKGIKVMVDEDKDCEDVLSQIAAVMGAMKGVWLQVVEDHLHGCVSRAALDGGKDDDLVHKLISHIKKFT